MGSGSPSKHHRRVPLADLPAHRMSLAEKCRYGPLVLTDGGEDMAAVVSLEFLYQALSVLHGNREVFTIAEAPEEIAASLRKPSARDIERGLWEDEENISPESPTR